jgi:hypothetical protein
VRNEARVNEQSHKDEMRAALKGDFERMRARHGNAAEPDSEPEPDSVPALGSAVVAGDSAVARDPDREAPVARRQEQQPSWHDRLLGRHRARVR